MLRTTYSLLGQGEQLVLTLILVAAGFLALICIIRWLGNHK